MEESVILEQLFDNGMVTTEIEVIPGKSYLTIRNLEGNHFSTIDQTMYEAKGSKMYLLQLYGIHKIAVVAVSRRTLKETLDFPSTDAAFDWINNLPGAAIDKISKKQTEFEVEIRKALKAEVVEKTFFEKDDSLAKPEQSSEE